MNVHFKFGHPGLFWDQVYLVIFKQTMQFVQQIDVKIYPYGGMALGFELTTSK